MMSSQTALETAPRQASVLIIREQPFWQHAGAAWRQLAGSIDQAGFSFEWHEWDASAPLNWARSFHPHSVEICLNLQGTGWVATSQERIEFSSETAGFFVTNGNPLSGERHAGQRHQFLSVEFSMVFLKSRLAEHLSRLHPALRHCLRDKGPAALSRVTTLTHRQRDLLSSLLRPPVLASAQRLWYESKALEFAAEFFFSAGEAEPLCSRAQRLAAERVSRAKAILAENLAEPPTLEELGRRVACSQFYLSRTFTRETGLTISQWLRRARLERAAELLSSGKFNVTEAALEVGYSSLSHFSQAFHEMFGCCPGLYPLKTPTQQNPPAPCES
ncbi:MAG TPA: AraC family transcriptional regulator [Clostridia bacterium]|nr:AraC family transcriptional regulator [Clostridia bacterium]